MEGFFRLPGLFLGGKRPQPDLIAVYIPGVPLHKSRFALLFQPGQHFGRVPVFCITARQNAIMLAGLQGWGNRNVLLRAGKRPFGGTSGFNAGCSRLFLAGGLCGCGREWFWLGRCRCGGRPRGGYRARSGFRSVARREIIHPRQQENQCGRDCQNAYLFLFIELWPAPPACHADTYRQSRPPAILCSRLLYHTLRWSVSRFRPDAISGPRAPRHLNHRESTALTRRPEPAVGW